MPKSELEVVIPIYNELEVLPDLLERVIAALEGLKIEWKVLLVNDGSRDGSREWMLKRVAGDSRLLMVDLSRNWGLAGAVHAGILESEAEAIVVLDGDLQDPPELIPELYEKWKSGGVDIVVAARRLRKEKGLKRGLILAFHRVFQWLSDFPVPENVGNFSLLSRAAVEALNDLPERHRFFPGLRSWVGFRQATVYYDRDDRSRGEAKQTVPRLFAYAFDAIFSFSYKPLRLMTLGGALVSTLGFVLALNFVVKRLLGVEVAATGFTTLVTVSLFLGGIQLLAVGVLGEYVGRIYDEVKGRSIQITRKVYGNGVCPKDDIR